MSTKDQIVRAVLFWSYDLFELLMLGIVICAIALIADAAVHFSDHKQHASTHTIQEARSGSHHRHV